MFPEIMLNFAYKNVNLEGGLMMKSQRVPGQSQPKPNIGILASRMSKKRLKKLLETHQVELGKGKCRIYATGKTYKYLTNAPYYNGLPKEEKNGSPFANGIFDFHELREGPDGGVVQLAGMVVDDKCEIVIFLTDAADTRFTSTENGALLRVCNVLGVKIFLNMDDAEFWVTHEFKDDVKNLKKWVDSDLKPILLHPSYSENTEAKRTLALIAHDNKKEEMFEFAMEHKERLRAKFHEPEPNPPRIIATGHTGTGVQKVTGGDLRIQKLKSGPKGGDVEIANKVLDGTCHHVLFFMDPLTPHPHYEDIRLLMNICCLPDVEVTLRTNKKSAADWIKHI